MKKIVSLSTFSPLALKGVWWTISFPKAAAVKSILANMNPVRNSGKSDTNYPRSPFRAGVESPSKYLNVNLPLTRGKSQLKRRFSFLSNFQPLPLKGVWWTIAFPIVRTLNSGFGSQLEANRSGAPFRVGVKSLSKHVNFTSKPLFSLYTTNPLLP